MKSRIFSLQASVLILTALFTDASGQDSRLNFGLTRPQDPSTLPVSAVKPPVAARSRKSVVSPLAQKLNDNEYLLREGWDMAEASLVTASQRSLFSENYSTSEWFNAVVPGTVLTTLVNSGVYPDPWYGLNNLYITDSLCRKDWWYRLELPLPESARGRQVWLLFNGINYKADIWLNGVMIGRIAGAFIRGNFNITKQLRTTGKNILAVHIFPPNNPGIPHEESSRTPAGPNGGQLCLDGPTFISSEGWDWVPGIRDRNIGIWQDVRLKITDAVTLSDPQVITDLDLPDTTAARITIRVNATNHGSASLTSMIKGIFGKEEFGKNVEIGPGKTIQVTFSPNEFPSLYVKNPGLWWPNGYGRQELSRIGLTALDGRSVSDRIEVRFGIREYSYELSLAKPDRGMQRIGYYPQAAAGRILFNNIDRTDLGNGVFLPKLADGAEKGLLEIINENSDNPYLVVKVNGVPVFCKGGNWGMDDGMKRVSRERLEPYFRLHKEAGFNMVRNWTGESTEELFYDLCDEYGLLVWNDFWLSTEGYNLNVNDDVLFMKNATDVVKRFRNHPSIAVWCPRNEGYATPRMEADLVKLIAEEDGTRHYAPNSRNLNLRPSGPWNYFRNASDYFTRTAEGFNTELGTPSVPTASTIRSFMPVADQWPISDTWYYHDLHNGQKDYISAIDSLYGQSNSLDDFCKKAQMINYDSHRAMFESWNSKMWNKASGLLLWMSHPAWPSMVWQTYSWDYETHGSYFGSMKGCEPVHIQMNQHDNKVVVINTTLKNYSDLTAAMEIFTVSGKKVKERSVKISSRANSPTDCFVAELPSSLTSVYLVRVTLTDGKKVLSLNDYWKTGSSSNYRELNSTGEARLISKLVKSERGKATFEISNTAKTSAVAVKLTVAEGASGRIILPAWFSDGYFNLLPGEKRLLTVEIAGELKGKDITAEGYNVKKIVLLKFN